MEAPVRRRLLLGCLALALGSGASLAWLRIGRPLYYTDGIWALRGDRLPGGSTLQWQRPEPWCELPGPVRGRVQPMPDGTLVYGRVQPDGTSNLVRFDPARPDLGAVTLSGLASPGEEFAPALGPDGRLYFTSDRPGGAGGLDLWVARTDGRIVSTPRPIVELNTEADESDPAPAPDGGLVFVRRDSETPVAPTRLWRSRPDGTVAPMFGAPPQPGSIERDPSFAADGVSLWFVRQRAGEAPRVCRTWTHRDEFVAPFGYDELTMPGGLHSPATVEHGFALLLVGAGDAPIAYRSRARELYPWWEGQRWLEQLALVTLIVSLLCTLLLLLGRRFRQLDIVTWCLLFSLLVHLVLLAVLGRLQLVYRYRLPPGSSDRIEVQLVASEDAASADAPQGFRPSDEIAFRGHEAPALAEAPATEAPAPTRATEAPSLARFEPTRSATPAAAMPTRETIEAVAASTALDASARTEAAELAASAPRDAPAQPQLQPQTAAAERIVVETPGSQVGAGALPRSVAELAHAAPAPREVGTAPAALRDAAAAPPVDRSVVASAQPTQLAPPAAAAPAGATIAPAPRSTDAPLGAAAPPSASDATPVARHEAPVLPPGPQLAQAAPVAAPMTSAEVRFAEPVAATASADPSPAPSAAALPAGAPAAAAAPAPKAAATAPPIAAAPGSELPAAAGSRSAPAPAALEPAPLQRTVAAAPAAALHDPVPAAEAGAAPAPDVAATAARGKAAAVALDPLAPGGGAASVPELADHSLPPVASRPGTEVVRPVADARALPELPAAPAARRGPLTPTPAPLRDAPAGTAAPVTVSAPSAVKPVAFAASATGTAPAVAPISPPAPHAGGVALTEATAPDGEALAPLAREVAALPSGAPALQRRELAVPRAVMPPAAASAPGLPVATAAEGHPKPAGAIALPALAPIRADFGAPVPAFALLAVAPPELPPSFVVPLERERALQTAVVAPELFRNRFGVAKAEAIERFGGSAETERAVQLGLQYLASIQNPDGSWGDPRHFDPKYGETCVGKSALCLLAFLGAGHQPGGESEFAEVAARAVRFLVSKQDRATGHFGRTSSYSHGITTYALAECYGLTKDERLRGPLVQSLGWILRQQSRSRDARNRGGWGYFSPSLQPEDRYARASITAWMVMALESAKLAGIPIEDEPFQLAKQFLLQSFDSRHGYFLYSREPGRLRSSWRTLPASTPASVFALSLLGVPREDFRMRAGLEWTLERAPESYRRFSDEEFVLNAAGNIYFWYYGTLACFLAGGEAWEDWNRSLKELLPRAQSEDGSFRPIDAYARYAGDNDGDRAYTTAMCVLSLEIYYRYFTPLLVGR